MNELIFIFHSLIIGGATVFALWLGKESLIAFIALMGVLSNLFITKQIMLFGFDVVATDAFAVGAVLGLQLLQEYYGRTVTKKAIGISFFLLVFYGVMSWMHLTYIPSISDSAHPHFQVILFHMPRLVLASLFSFFASQLLDYQVYGFFKKVFSGKYLLLRSYSSLFLVQLFDTVLFSFLGLYGIISNVWNVIFMSFAIKMVVILLATPFVAFSQKLIKT